MLKTALFAILLICSGVIITIIFLSLILFFVGKRIFRSIVQRLFGLVMGRLLSDNYAENLMELWSAVRRSSVLNIVEQSLRAENGTIIKRALGSSKHFNHYDNLLFVPAQMTRTPLESEVSVDVQVSLGPKAVTPLELKIPFLISGMGYGVALSEESRLALAKGAKQAGTALNSGEGPYLKEERDLTDKYIWQIGRGSWGRDPQAIAAADMIEVQMGQGARVGAHKLDPNEIKGKAQKLMGISPVESALMQAVIPGIKNPWDWQKYVEQLRQDTGGKPIAIKLMAGGRLEGDLAVAIEAGFDVIVLDGVAGGSHASSPLLQDDFGLPSIQALTRAQRYLCNQGVRKEVSLIVGGRYFTPGECLKALALGADAIYLGTVPLFALVHRQTEKILPWEPLTQLVYYDSKYKKRLDVDLAAKSVANVLKSMTLEIEEGIRALGKSSLAELGPNDLIALDDWTAEITGVAKG